MHRILIPLIIILLFIIIIRQYDVEEPDEIKCKIAYYNSPQLMSVPDHVL